MKTILRSSLLPFLILSFGFAAGDTILSHVNAQSSSADQSSGITFPVAELGGCSSKDECKTYCNDASHMQACIKFAQDHGLMNKDEAARAENFRAKLQSGGGPGGCKSPGECEAFCNNTANLETCISFAKEHGIQDQNIENGQKILGYIKSGGKMPGGCTSKDSCEKYCNDFSHAQECFDFMSKVGLPQPGGDNTGSGISPGIKEKKFLEVIQQGGTPGNCKSKDECETYCRDQSHRDECISFGVKAGFIKPEEAEMMKKSGGNGPGGCNSPDSCQTYCNDIAHHDECLKFAEQHGFMNQTEVGQAKEGLTRLREGLENAPDAVKSCIKSNLGENTLDDIQSGQLVPGPDTGAAVKNCFEKFGQSGNPEDVFKNISPEVTACLKEKLGDQYDKIRSGETMPTPQMADTFRVCFANSSFQSGPPRPGPGNSSGQPGQSGMMMQNFLKSAPSQVQACFKEKLGSDYDKIQNGEQVQVDATKMKSCFEEFRPQSPDQNPETNSGGSQGQLPPTNSHGGGPGGPSMPPEVIKCVNGILGGDGLAKLQSGQITEDQKNQISTCAQKVNGGSMPNQGNYPNGPQSGSYQNYSGGSSTNTYPNRTHPGSYPSYPNQSPFSGGTPPPTPPGTPSGGTPPPPPPSGSNQPYPYGPQPGNYQNYPNQYPNQPQSQSGSNYGYLNQSPPSGMTPPPTGSYPNYTNQQPPAGGTSPPPPPPPPASSPTAESNHGNILGAVISTLGKIIRFFF